MSHLNLEDEIFKDPEIIKSYLSIFGFTKFRTHRNNTYITMARGEGSSPTGITCYLDKNKAFLIDYSKDIKGDLISFVMKEKKLGFFDVIRPLSELVEGKYIPSKVSFSKPNKYFSGLFDRRNHYLRKLKPLSFEVLEHYESRGNDRFLRDGISLETQNRFRIGYENKTQQISIPYFDVDGNLLGVKARANTENPGSKYSFLQPFKASLALFGVWQNREHLFQADRIYVFEAEKSVMQAYTFGIKNCVSIGNSSISRRQSELLIAFAPKEIVLMLDEGLSESVIARNCRTLVETMHLVNIPVRYWVPSEDIPSKSSPTDLGKERFLEEIHNTKEFKEV